MCSSDLALGLRCCVQAFSSCGEWELHFVVVHGLLLAVASLVAEPGAQVSSCGTRGMWDLPGPGIKPVSPALAGGFLSTAPPGKFCVCSLMRCLLRSLVHFLIGCFLSVEF